MRMVSLTEYMVRAVMRAALFHASAVAGGGAASCDAAAEVVCSGGLSDLDPIFSASPSRVAVALWSEFQRVAPGRRELILICARFSLIADSGRVVAREDIGLFVNSVAEAVEAEAA